jgi:hypothetical protein
VSVPAPPGAQAPLVFTPESGPSPIITRRLPARRFKRSSMRAIAAIVVACIVLAGAGAIWMNRVRKSAETAEQAEKNDFPSQLAPLGSAWRKDGDLQLKMQVTRAYRRSQPAAAMAFFSHDYKKRLPGKAELIDGALEKLHLQFKRIDWEPATTEEKLGGEPALTLDFDATDGQEVDVLGKVYLLGYRGVGYWVFVWAPAGDREAATAELDRARASLTLNRAFREGWQEKPPEAAPLSIAPAGVVLSATKGVWEEEDRTGYDPKAVRVAKGTFPVDGSTQQRDRHAGRIAIAQILLLDDNPAKQPADQAREYVLANQKDPVRGGYPKTTIAPVKGREGEELSRETDLGELHGWLSKLRMSNTEDRERFVVLATVRQPKGKLLAVWCECDWELREYWDQEFGTLVSSLRPMKKGEVKPIAPAADAGNADE